MKKTLIAFLSVMGCAMATSLDDAKFSLTVGDTTPNTTSISGVGTGSFSMTYTLNVSYLDSLTLTGTTTGEFKNTSIISISDSGNKHIGSALGYSSVRLDENGTITKDENSTAYVRAWGVFQEAASVTSNNDIHSGNYYGGNNLVDVPEGGITMQKMEAANDLSNIKAIGITQVHEAGVNTTIYTTVFYADDTSVSYKGIRTDAYPLRWGAGYGDWATLGVNTDMVSSVYLFEGAVNEETAYGLNLAAVSVPEPTTATLSLLALAGLASRRRRK